jgi:acetyltransferase-like isoleucine patch superfamily enzyme
MVRRLVHKLISKVRGDADLISEARRVGVRIGENCRLLTGTLLCFGSEPYLIRIGNHVTVTHGVNFVTHDGGVWVFREADPDIDVFGAITVGDNVFIGIKSTIMPGVTIGSNSIVGAGSMVTKDVESGTVVAGVPARVICRVDEYKEKIKDRAMRIRSLPEDEKRAILTKRFWGDLDRESKE